MNYIEKLELWGILFTFSGFASILSWIRFYDHIELTILLHTIFIALIIYDIWKLE